MVLNNENNTFGKEDLFVFEDLCKISQDLFLELYNNKLWKIYKNYSLINKIPKENYLVFEFDKPIFNHELYQDLFSKNFIKNIFSSIKISFLLTNKLKDNKVFDEIDLLYSKEIKLNYNKLTFDEKKAKLKYFWNKIIDFFEYLVISNLILQNDIILDLNSKWTKDLNSEKFNSLIDLKKNKLSKDDFDFKFGFLSEKEYDLSFPRYFELKNIKVNSLNYVKENFSKNNFRDFVKFKFLKLLTLIRQVLLSFNEPNIFNLTYNDIINNNSLNNKKLLQKNIILKEKKKEKEKKIKNNKKINNLKKTNPINLFSIGAKIFSGSGIISGKVLLINSKKDFDKIDSNSILITRNLDPDLFLYFDVCKCIICERGSSLSHLSILGREKDFKIIGQFKNIFDTFKNGDDIIIDINKGLISFEN